jgi:hypothetical protein
MKVNLGAESPVIAIPLVVGASSGTSLPPPLLTLSTSTWVYPSAEFDVYVSPDEFEAARRKMHSA